MATELIVRQDTDMFMPIMSVETAVERYSAVVQYVQKLLHDGTDFGTIPGTQKATLLKPGAEKLCTLFGLSKRFELVKDIENWGDHGEPFFYYLYRCGLYRGNTLIAESDGSCNSHEVKYRWRKGERVCPECGKATIIKGKAEYGGGWLCWRKVGKSDGCGEKFTDADERITGQNVERVANPDIADQVNTIQKMAQKRALIAATLLAVNASEFFTQDLEDLVDIPNITPEPHQTAATPRNVTPPKSNGKTPGMLEAEARALKGAIVGACKTLNELGDHDEPSVPKWGVKRANEFAKTHFGGKTVDELDVTQLSEMARLLSERIDGIKTTGELPAAPVGDRERENLIASIKTNFDSQKHLDTYLTENNYKGKLEDLTTPQLKKIDLAVGVPF